MFLQIIFHGVSAAAMKGKKLSPIQISNTINEIKKPVVLIGGDGDQEISSQVLRLCNYKKFLILWQNKFDAISIFNKK